MSVQNSLNVTGNFQNQPPAEVITEISQAKLSGSLRLAKEKEKIILYFDEGDIIFAVSNSRKHRLFAILLSENKIPKEQLVNIEDFTNDLQLAKNLVEKEIFTQPATDALFGFQINRIIRDFLNWTDGEWTFSPLAKIKEGIKFEVDLSPTLFKYAQQLNLEKVLSRFWDMDEIFLLNTSKELSTKISPTPNEAFVLSRIGETDIKVSEIRSMCGLENSELLRILYNLWLGGFIIRKNWKSIFDAETIDKLSSAKLQLKKSAVSYEEKKKQEEEAQKAAQEKAEKELEEQNKEKNKGEISLEQYLERIEGATTYYEIFGVPPEANVKQIKRVYFSFAKKFHPDKYYKKVERDVHRQIQSAFTEIAKAYETLKDSEARELYDFKLRKVIEALKKDQKNETPSSNKNYQTGHKEEAAAQKQFDKGYNLFKAGQYKESAAYFARAVGFNTNNAQYHAYYGKTLGFDKKQRHKAEHELQIAIELEPQNEEYKIMLAELYVEIGLMARAKGELNRLLKTHPNNREAKSLLDSISQK